MSTPWCRKAKPLAAEFGVAETYPKASVGYAVGALPAAADPAPIVAEMKRILADYLKNGIPADLVEAAKRKRNRRRGIPEGLYSRPGIVVVGGAGGRGPSVSR